MRPKNKGIANAGSDCNSQGGSPAEDESRFRLRTAPPERFADMDGRAVPRSEEGVSALLGSVQGLLQDSDRALTVAGRGVASARAEYQAVFERLRGLLRLLPSPSPGEHWRA